MTSKSQIAIEPRRDGRWAVQADGTKGAYRVTDRKSDAVAYARQVARKWGAELVIKDEGGGIARQDSQGEDPRNVEAGALT